MKGSRAQSSCQTGCCETSWKLKAPYAGHSYRWSIWTAWHQGETSVLEALSFSLPPFSLGQLTLLLKLCCENRV